MSYMPNPELTVKQGLDIQAKQLAKWELILKPEVYTKIAKEVAIYNDTHNYVDGYDVFRGNQIDMLVMNYRR
jgi:hypothetical protein